MTYDHGHLAWQVGFYQDLLQLRIVEWDHPWVLYHLACSFVEYGDNIVW